MGYEGKEDELIKNLKKMKSKQEVAAAEEKKTEDPNKAAKQANIRSLVTETNPGKTADELIVAYDGKEDDLIKNLEKMKTKQSKKAERKMLPVKRESVKALVAGVKPGKSVDDLMTTYEGKEDDLIKNLEKMKDKQEKNKAKSQKLPTGASSQASLQDQVRSLVAETSPGKSADDLLAAYVGREGELI